MDFEQIDAVLEKYGYCHSEIVSIMQEVQGLENFLPPETLRYISKKMELNLARIYDIATFYKAFSLVPRGRHVVKVCCGTACHLGGAAQSLARVKNILAIEEGETTDDRMFSIETVNCLGSCALAPVIMVGKDYYDAVQPGKVEKILTSYLSLDKR